jgi:hypothetical protein
MKDIIKDWGLQDPQKAAQWNEAADKWRLPYWDWARRQTYTEDFSLPAVFTKPQVRIWPPSEVSNKYPSAKAYANPLWGFDNPETDDDGVPLPFGKMPQEKTQYNIKNDPANSSTVPANKTVMPVCPLFFSLSRNTRLYDDYSGLERMGLVDMVYSLLQTSPDTQA